MALLSIATDVSIDTSMALNAPQTPDIIAGENLFAGACVYLKTADGKVYLSNGTAVGEAAEFFGIVPRAALAGQPVTVFHIGTRLRYAVAGTLGPGDKYFVAATAGRLDTAATTGGTVAIAQAVNDTDIHIIKMTD